MDSEKYNRFDYLGMISTAVTVLVGFTMILALATSLILDEWKHLPRLLQALAGVGLLSLTGVLVGLELGTGASREKVSNK